MLINQATPFKKLVAICALHNSSRLKQKGETHKKETGASQNLYLYGLL